MSTLSAASGPLSLGGWAASVMEGRLCASNAAPWLRLLRCRVCAEEVLMLLVRKSTFPINHSISLTRQEQPFFSSWQALTWGAGADSRLQSLGAGGHVIWNSKDCGGGKKVGESTSTQNRGREALEERPALHCVTLLFLGKPWAPALQYGTNH